MKLRSTLGVLFYLKKSSIRENGEIPIYVRITTNGHRSDISTRQFVTEENWSFSTQRVRNTAIDAVSINETLDDFHQQIKKSHKQLLKENRPITAQAIKKRVLGEDKPVLTCKQLMAYHREFELQKLAKGTAKNYGATETYLKRFMKEVYRSDDIFLSQIDYTFITKFENYLRTCRPLRSIQPLTNNGLMKHMERFQKFINLAYKHGWIMKNPFALYKLKFEEYDCAFLEQEELDLLERINLSNKSHETVRDMFVFSCYTGLAYIEVKNLTTKSLVTGIDDEQWIMLRRQKSKTPVKLPILEPAQRILDKYVDYPSDKNNYSLLPILSNQKMNQHIKSIIKKCGIEKKITFHAARHTFATTVTLLNDVPIETVSKMLGHTKLSTTQRYARVVEKKISNDMAELRMKLKKPKDKPEYKKTAYDHLKII